MPDFTLHYRSPAWRSAILGSDALGLLGVAPAGAATSDALAFTGPILRSNNQMVSGTRLSCIPVKDLDIGVDGKYIRTALNNGVSSDISTYALRDGNSQDAARCRFRMWRYF